MDYTGYISERIKLYIFDLDGTLVDSLFDLSDAVNGILGRYGLPSVPSDIVRQGIGIGSRNLLFRCFAWSAKQSGRDCPVRIAETGIRNDSDPLTSNERGAAYPGFDAVITDGLKEYHELYMQRCTQKTAFYPGIEKWLAHLAGRGVRMAVLSNKPETATVKILRSLNTVHLFDVIAGPESTGVLKPDPAGIVQIIKKTGILPAETAMIGDSTVDIETGRNAGVLVCGITGGYGDDKALRESGCEVLIERSLGGIR